MLSKFGKSILLICLDVSRNYVGIKFSFVRVINDILVSVGFRLNK